MATWHNADTGETQITADGSALDQLLESVDGWEKQDG